jgi:hypothetical protein
LFIRKKARSQERAHIKNLEKELEEKEQKMLEN